jgi:BlaI family transcriptional regulator, penicillinase repressor
MPKPAKPALSALENSVMRIVWKSGQVTAEFVRETLAATRPLKDSTVRTVLRRLEQKGYLAHTVEGRTYHYTSTVGQRNVAADAVRGIIQRLCNGSVEDLLLGMVDRELLSPDTLRDLAHRIEVSERDEEKPANKPTCRKPRKPNR